MADIKYFPDASRGRPEQAGGSGSGPEDPMLEKRVEVLEVDIKDVKASLSRIELVLAEMKGAISQMPKATDLGAIRAEIAEVKGRLSNLPTWWMLLIALIATWGAGAALVKFGLK